MKIVLLDNLSISTEMLEEMKSSLEKEGHEFIAYERNENLETQIEHAKDADVIITANLPIRKKLIEACPHLKLIDVAFTGVDHIAIEEAKKRKIKVSNAAGYSTQTVAELTLCMMITLLRKIKQVEEKCRNGETKEGLIGTELSGKTVGIIGAGTIGRKVADLCHAFSCNVLGYNPHHTENTKIITFVSLEELLKTSDIVSIHCPLNDSTYHLLDKEHLALMKKNSILINTARGGIIDTKALVEALRNKKIKGAGIDVFDTEPPLPKDHPLFEFDHVLLTPHIGFASEESFERRANIVLTNILEWEKGNQINIVV